MVALVAVLRADMVVNVVVLPARTARWVSCSWAGWGIWCNDAATIWVMRSSWHQERQLQLIRWFLPPLAFLAFCIWKRATGGKNSLVILCRCITLLQQHRTANSWHRALDGDATCLASAWQGHLPSLQPGIKAALTVNFKLENNL